MEKAEQNTKTKKEQAEKLKDKRKKIEQAKTKKQ